MNTNKIVKLIFISLIINILTFLRLNAQNNETDTIRLSEKRFLTKDLQAGTNQYLVYAHAKEVGKVFYLGVWSRKISLEKWRGQEVIVISQDWYSQDTATTRTIFSVAEGETFKPIYHYAKSPKQGIEAFNFETNKIVGADSLANNLRKGWSIDLKEPTLNWELDMEILAILPYKEGKHFAVNFYHPGSKMPPQYYVYKVLGSEKLVAIGNHSIDCWQVRIDYNATMYATFWISKKTKEVIKMKEFFGSGYRYKIKLGVNIE